MVPGNEHETHMGNIFIRPSYAEITMEEGHGNPLQDSCLENPWTEEPGGLQSIDSCKESDMTEANEYAHTHAEISY